MDKKKIKIFSIVLFSILLSTFLYLNSNHYINNQNWKYRNGYYIGDILTKNDNHLTYEKKLCFGFFLIIENNYTNEKGFYINK